MPRSDTMAKYACAALEDAWVGKLTIRPICKKL
jgi:hypothetical protein